MFLMLPACDFTPADTDTDTDTPVGGTADTGSTDATGSTSDAATGSVDGLDTTGGGPDSGDGTEDGPDSGGPDSGGPGAPPCEALCADLVDAACDSGPTLAGCQLTCQALTSSDSCDATAATYFECVAEGDVTCNGIGEPVVEGCAVAYLEAIGCAVSENPNPELVEPCATHCDNIAEAACPANASVEDCNTNCLWLGATGTGCDDEWAGYLTCFDEAEVSCLVGFAVAAGCGPAFTAYSDCIDAAAGG
ncbi:MAG: hypothetical protein AAF721_02730 [Myxococcota bacterium]